MATGIMRAYGGGGGMSGAAPRGYNSASGGIPGVTSPVGAVRGQLGGIGSIISSITGSQSSALRDQYPDEYFSTLGTLLGNTDRRAKGDISDLLPELQQSSAEDAVYGGLSGSEAENTKLLRDLGLTRYGVQNEAINSLGKIQGQIPTVRPFDPSGIIAAQIAAQERADMFAAAPVPEDAYQRAMNAAGGGGGGGGRGGLSYNFGGGGGGAPRVVDTSMRGYGPSVAQYGTARDVWEQEPAPWGSFPNAIAGGQDSFDPMWDTDPWNPTDFGGSLDFEGGQGWSGLDTDIFDLLGTDGGGVDEWLTTDYGPASNDYYDEGY